DDQCGHGAGGDDGGPGRGPDADAAGHDGYLPARDGGPALETGASPGTGTGAVGAALPPAVSERGRTRSPQRRPRPGPRDAGTGTDAVPTNSADRWPTA